QFCRIFDFVNVPSPFIQADSYVNPSFFSSSYTSGASIDAYTKTAALTYRAPFNKLSRFREPGRININTVFDDPTVITSGVTSALFKGYPAMDPDTNTSSNFSARTITPSTYVSNLRLSRQGNNSG